MNDPAEEFEIPSGVLLIDTSTDDVGIAVSALGMIASRTWDSHRDQTTTLLPEIAGMLRTVDMHAADISHVVVAKGPGTFTGLRVGMSVAKGLVAALGVPIIGINTFDILFYEKGPQTVAVLPAGRGRVVWQRKGEYPRNTTVDELFDYWRQNDVQLTGTVQESQREQFERAGYVRWESRHPATALVVGALRIRDREFDDPVTLEPTYIHGTSQQAGPIIDKRPS